MIKHILLCTDDPGLGGAAQCNHSLLCGLVKLGYRITCVQSETSNSSITHQQLLGIEHIWIESEAVDFFRKTFENPRTKPDVIIFSNSCPFSNLKPKETADELRIPYIIIEHLVDPQLATQFEAYLNCLAHQYIVAKSVIAVSQENLNLLHQWFKLPRDQGQVIHYGRPSRYFTPRDSWVRERLRMEWNIPLDAVVCFTAARIEPRKGYQYQLEAIKRLMLGSVWSKLYFVWAGAGIFDPQLEAELKTSIQQLGIAEKVKFLGQIPDVSEWLDGADIFVFPSQLEGMPLCVMEAMAKALPVIATAVSGIPEELGNTGKLLTDPKIDSQATIAELVATIEEWVANSPMRHSIGQACKLRAEELFKEERMVEDVVQVIERVLLPTGDYVSPGLSIIRPDNCFPHMIVGDVNVSCWPYLRREIPHNWYVDERQPTVGFLSRDEAHILYNTALKLKGKKALEIGCWQGWSACHLALAGVELDVVDPLLDIAEFHESVRNSLEAANVLGSVTLVAGYSPTKVEEIASQFQRKWSLIFIDGDHEEPGPLQDAIACEQLAEADAIILFHDLASPDVAQGLDYLRQRGWNTMVYQTMQIMGVAWRGHVEPVSHQPDPRVYWKLPEHLKDYCVDGISNDYPDGEFGEILSAVRPYTLLSEARLFSLYSQAKQVCLDDVPGNFVECGVYKGGGTALLAVVAQRYSLRPRLVYAFDTFEGMPDPTEVNRHQGIPANQTGFGAGTLKAPVNENLDKICQLLNVKDIVVSVQGLFAETLPQYKARMSSIAFLHAGGDWYESTMDIFNTLYDSVVSNGIIQVDDYGHWEGCKKAIHDFERLRGESFALHTIDETGVWFQKNVVNSVNLSPRIIIDGVFFQLYKTGIARVWTSLLAEWAKSGFAKHIIVLNRAGTAPKIAGIWYRDIPPYGYENTESDREMLQQVCDEEGAELFISTYYTTPLSTPSVFMAYDMIPEVIGADLNEAMWREKHHAIYHACGYVAISENTAKDLKKFFPEIAPQSLTVAHCGVQRLFSPGSQEDIKRFKDRYGISKPYFISVGGGAGYKNSILFFKAFAQLASRQGFEIVFTGSGAFLEPEWRNYTSGTVVHKLQLDDEELRLAYSGAIALVYPSKYEGFGLPVLEAMACGCPVITCPNASIPEVAGEAALYVSDENVEGLSDALCEVQKPTVRNSLIAAGLKQAKKFSWQNMAETIGSALVNATLIPLNLNEINLIVFPDWTQPEESLYRELARVVRTLATHPDKSKMTLLVDASTISHEEADLALSSVVMSLLMEEELDVSDGPEISLVGKLSEVQWSALLLRVNDRITLEHDSREADDR